ncbi:MAG: Sulfate transporter/antisigma-factor antagonist STAS [Candidatus Gallionella acididurans]|uniref:Sulfate transporter/antisigma-factor antagonist STAS n=1 Tax=Candidatus Gallionella acididurans TaxID=1796491 RepID=A0A139BWT7_9PROT|nr:MAG: Sulfate transporter/antisigma-factor antagonist STAS [Candidatus Gallionella acididurans]
MIKREGEWMVAHGNLTMDTVPALFETGLQHLASEDLQLDFSRVESVDSAAVSMLLGWARAAQRTQHELRVKGLPEDLLSLANLYGVAEMLPKQSV